MLNWLFGGRVANRLNPTKKVKINGVTFTLRKLNPLDYLAGAKALQDIHKPYERAAKAPSFDFSEKEIQAVKTHYRDVLLQGIVSVRCLGRELVPTLKDFAPGEAKIKVENFMSDWDMAERLYQEIVEFTYGKKKLRAILSFARKSLS